MKKILSLALFLVSTSLFAADPAVQEATEQSGGVVGADKLGDFGFGVGIGVNTIFSGDDIQNAKIDSTNIVRVTDSANTRINFWLESHYVFGGSYKSYLCGGKEDVGQNFVCYNGKSNEKGEPQSVKAGEAFLLPRKSFISAFFAVNVSDSDSVIKGAAVGPMWTLRQIDRNTGKPTDRYFNLGLGLSITKVQRIAGGLKDGQSVPMGTQIEYSNEMEPGVVLLFSVGIN